MRKFTLLFIISLCSLIGYSQIGSTCATPYLISSLPFNLSATTDSTGNNYSGICGSTYSDQNTFLMEYTPATDIYINAECTNTGMLVGLFITAGCPDIGTCVDFNEALAGNPVLNTIFLTGGITYYFIISNNDPTGMGIFPSTAFTIDITEVQPYDSEVLAVLNLESGCSQSSTQTITASIYNNGADTLNGFDISYTINGGAAVTETVSTIILPTDTFEYTFAATTDFSAQGIYNIAVYTTTSGDMNTSNDTAYFTLVTTPVVNSFPYFEDFETMPNWWSAGGTNSSWELATPAATNINSAFSGTYSWVTNAIGNTNANELSYLISPCFDFTSLTKPRIEFEINYSTTIILSTATLEYTIDNGLTWQVLDIGSAEMNWDNPWSGAAAGWIHVSNTVPYLAGTSNVKFRLAYDRGFIANEGVAIDDFQISDCTAADPVADFTFVMNGLSVTFTDNSTGATSWNWDFGDFQTSADQNPIHDYMIPNTYTVLLTVQNECGMDTMSQVIIIVSDDEIVNNNGFIIYPNPANDIINISKEGKLEIFNLQGVLLKNIIITNHKSISTEELSSGVYLYRFLGNNSNYEGKLIIIK